MKAAMVKLSSDQLRAYSGVALVPVDNDLDGIPFEEVMVEIHVKRNPKNHRRYFSFVRQAFSMQEDFEEEEIFRKYIQMKAGHYDAVVTPKGETMYWPKSIDWSKLEEPEFKKLFNEVVNAFIRYYGKKLDEHQINAILEY